MSCETVNGLIDRYIDGELSPQEERELRAHAAACADCAQKFREAKYLKELLGGMDDDIVAPLEAQADGAGRLDGAERLHQRTEAARRVLRRAVAAHAVRHAVHRLHAEAEEQVHRRAALRLRGCSRQQREEDEQGQGALHAPQSSAAATDCASVR